MAETDLQSFREGPEYARWTQLHTRVTAGEVLSAEDRGFYERIIDWLDETEVAQFEQAAQQVREENAALEEENQRLRAQYEVLREQISSLEERLAARRRAATTGALKAS